MRDTLASAQQAHEYEITTRILLEQVRLAVPREAPLLVDQTAAWAEEMAVQAVNAAWRAKDAIERLLQALRTQQP